MLPVVKKGVREVRGQIFTIILNYFVFLFGRYIYVTYICGVIIKQIENMTTFYNETSLNGKYQVMTTEELTGKGIRKVGDNYITEHKGKLFKNLKNYWVSKLALENIKGNYNTERACF